VLAGTVHENGYIMASKIDRMSIGRLSPLSFGSIEKPRAVLTCGRSSISFFPANGISR
jgi:hypothetical protein